MIASNLRTNLMSSCITICLGEKLQLLSDIRPFIIVLEEYHADTNLLFRVAMSVSRDILSPANEEGVNISIIVDLVPYLLSTQLIDV